MFGPPSQLSATPDTAVGVTSTVALNAPETASSTLRTAQLRVAQWGIDRAPIDVSLDMTPWASNMSPGSATSYLEVKSGRHKIYLAPADKTPGAQPESSSEVEVQLEPGSRATLFPRPLGTNPAAVLVSDALPPAAPNTGHVRVVNLSEQQGTLLVSSNRGVALSSERRKSTGFVAVSPGSHEVRIGTSGIAPFLREGFILNVPSGEVRTLIIMDAGPGIDAAVMNDARPVQSLVPVTQPVETTQAPETTRAPETAEPTAPTEPAETPAQAVSNRPPVTRKPRAEPVDAIAGGTPPTAAGALVKAAAPTQQAGSELALTSADSTSNDFNLAVAGIQGAGLALALSELARRVRRRSA